MTVPNGNSSSSSSSDSPWSTESPTTGYSRDKFYVTSTNGKGFSKSARWPVVSFNPGVLAEIGALMATGKFPEYRTQADFFRDATVHLLALRKEQLDDPEFHSRIDRVLKLAEIERLQYLGAIEKQIVETVTELLAKEPDPVKKMFIVAEARESVGYLESAYWRGELRRVIRAHGGGEGGEGVAE